MRKLVIGTSLRISFARALAVSLAMSALAARGWGADDARFVSYAIFDPSIVVSENHERTARSASGLVITPVFDSSITGDPDGAKIMNTINTAIAEYETQITDPVEVLIKFQNMSSGLGQSSTYYGGVSYSSYLSALTTSATTSDDATALANLPPGPNNPVNGNANMSATLPNLRALGFVANPPTGQADATIGLRTSICNLDRVTTDPMKYDLRAVVWHEIDEVLGFGSALNGLLNGSPAPTGPVVVGDLFRYDNAGSRSFNTTLDTTLATEAFFSLDGTTHLARFNQTAGGDYQDWFSTDTHTPQVQDAFATPGATPNLGVELTVLDVIGYTFGSATPPALNDDGGFIPPDSDTLKCEVGVLKNEAKIVACIDKCHNSAAAAALAGGSFNEEGCESSCRGKYDGNQGKLVAAGTCPACLGATQQTTLANQVETNLDSNNDGLYCAGSVSFGGDDAGVVPADADTLKCETGIMKNLAGLKKCVGKCHVKAATAALNGKLFDEEGCESTDPAKSCRAKFDAKTAKLLAKGICPACLDAAHQAILADQAESDLDSDNATLFCAGTTPLPPPW